MPETLRGRLYDDARSTNLGSGLLGSAQAFLDMPGALAPLEASPNTGTELGDISGREL
jgi:hypothetical protein